MPGLGSRLTAQISHHAVPLPGPGELADHQEGLAHQAVAGHQLAELLVLGVRGQAGHTQPALTAAHTDADLLVTDKDDLPGHWPTVQHLRLGQPQSRPGLHPHVRLVDGDVGDLQVREGGSDVLEISRRQIPPGVLSI